jgi:hypothetical protein
MQDWPLTLNRIIEHAAKWHGDRQVVSRRPDGLSILHQKRANPSSSLWLSRVRISIDRTEAAGTLSPN